MTTTFLKKHSGVFLNLLAIIFLVVVMGYAAWAVDSFMSAAGVAFSLPTQSGPSVSFDLAGAAALDLRGLMK